ncbi:hypothetical protein [Saccharopolyspora elongata]|uniref:Uncharacterized protein n=1 Tax=Saccharopolyspora elongata TaxID=2530387 RepID=A0A4R4Z5K4_9PSEU|nr:hypothetical protein [Saccharopolyspora elongata]TDD53365.1 hypothetical protein E1288_09650 [Saccharopolyspora elongata]
MIGDEETRPGVGVGAKVVAREIQPQAQVAALRDGHPRRLEAGGERWRVDGGTEQVQAVDVQAELPSNLLGELLRQVNALQQDVLAPRGLNSVGLKPCAGTTLASVSRIAAAGTGVLRPGA